MSRESYREQLNDLREETLYMSELVLEQLRDGIDALERKDDAFAQTVIEGDGRINERYLDLESDCIDLLALQQPVASDLRLIAATFKISTDLERIADLATNLAGYAQQAQREQYPEVDVGRIADLTVEMVEDAMTAYAEQDVEACYDVAERDDEVDVLCERASEQVVRDLIETELDTGPGNDPEDVNELMQEVSRLLLTIRDLERVGDHAVNIAARTLYMVERDDELLY